MNSYFAELGRTVLERWKQEDFSLAAFPALAQCALEERPPAEHVDLGGLVRDFLLEDDQPFQTASGFGQPELIVYDNPRFYIQVLFWLDGTTDIHQHEFSGAFHVLAGSSIHSQFAFENVRPITAHFQVGDLQRTETCLLETGRTVPIVSGRGCIHALFHLDSPSVTVVVRTHSDPGTGPQFTYLPPHVAVDPVHNDALTMRRKQLLDVLERTGDPEYPELVLAMVADLDFERGFFILQNAIGHLRQIGAWDDVWNLFSKKHEALASFVPPTLDEIIRRDGLSALRGSIEDIEHRFLLALLLNVPDRNGILEMVARRHPGDPLATILRWVDELGDSTDAGMGILDAAFPEELDVVEEERGEVFLAALRQFVTGGKLPVELGNFSVGEIATLHGAFVHSSWRALEAS
ncbi:MAG: hypothetical protein ACOYM3_03050 [Terrimicrobiaceae bacterium]